MKKKRLFSRAAALAMAAILMVPSSIGTTVFAADASTETGTESTEPEVSVAPEENNGADTQTGASEETGTDATPEIKTGTETKTASEETEKPKETKKKQKYTVTLEDAENGMLSFPLSEKDSIKADPENPAKAMKEANEQSLSSSKKYEEGSEVEIDAPAESGYTLEKIELTGKDGQKLQDLTVSEEGTVVFTMPEQDVAVKASFREWTEEEEESFDEELTEEELKESGLPAEEFTEEAMQQDAEALSDESAINMASLNDTASSSARLAGAKSIYLSVGGKCRYGRYLTHYFSTNEGQYAYCMNPMKKTPGGGWYTGYLIGNEDARKAFYYCYGGPGYSQFVNATGWIGDGSQQYEYAYSHVILSYMYATYALHDSGRANSAFHGLSTGTRNALINKANQMRYMASPPAGYGCYYFETGRQPIAFQVNNVSTLNLRKSSANPDITNGNPMYSLNGAQYGVYCDAGCTQLATTLTTDGNGNSNTVTLDPGTYYVKEYTAPQGYELDQTVKSIYLGNCDAKTITFSDEPINDPGAIEIQKLDKKTGENVQGIATLAGAQFTVNYYAGDYTLDNLPGSPTRSWVIQTKKKTVNGKDRYVTGLMDEYKVGGQSFYYVGNIPTIPLGTITIQETKAPAGYNKDLELTDTAGFSSKNGVYLANIRKEGDITKLTGGQTLQGTDSYFRGDLVFKKVDGINDNPMADIPFKITNTDTGESHTIYTGSDGIYDSSKIRNSLDTNSDKNGTGVWFGNTDLVDDADGAFEYGSYTIEEISCAANKGKVMYSGSFVINGENSKIDLGTIVNTSIEVSTTSYGSESETNRIQFDHKSPYYDMGTYKGDYATVLCDDINVKGLTSGYIVSKLVDKETGDFVKDENGSDLQATGKLIEYNDAAAGYTATGSITMPVKDVSNMLGKDYVFFTYIYELKSDGTPNYDNLLVSHTDMNDPQETVSFQNITTELTDSTTGLHDLQSNGKTITLKDKISLINFPSYDEINFYYIKYEGTLMDASGNPVTDSSGNPVKSTIACHQITKDELENGTSLTYDLSADVMKKYAGQKLTSYVQVYFSYTDPSVYENYIEWTGEKDLTNEDQSVSIPVITNTYVSTDNVSYTDTGIMDEVNMVGLIPGNVYTLQGKIVDRTTGKVISSSRTCTYGKDKYEITNVEPGKDGNYTLINADPYKVYHLKRAVSFSDGIAEGYYRLSDDGKDYVLCTESGKELEGNKIGKDAFEVEVLYPGSTFQEVTELSAVTTFTAGKDTAVKNVKFNFDPETLAGKSYVVTEDLYFAEKGLIGDADGDDLTGSTVYAVLYDDGSMDFQKSKKTYASKVVTEIYRFDESDHFGSVEEVPWYTNRNKVKSVSFKDKVSPESTAFLFGGMEYLTQISLDKLDTSNTTDMKGMFYNCKGLKSLDVSKLDTAKVTDMGWMFRDCQNLTSLNVKNFDTSNVTDMNKMFAACKTLSSLDVTGFDTSNVTAMDCMFQTCSNLTNIDVSKFNTAKVKSMNWMFYQDPKLQSADLSNFDFSNVEKFGSVFAEDSALTKVVFPKAADWSKIEELSYLFYQCGNLTSVTMPNACKTENLTNTHAMFYGCSKLTAIDTSCLKTDLVTDISFMFANCNALTALDVSKFHTSNAQDMQYMFCGCSNVSVIDVSGFDTAKVTNMQALFNGCSKVKILDVAGFDTSKVTDMQYMFCGCDSITTLDVSNFDTSNVTNMYDMFACAQLTALDCSSFNTSKVTNMRAMFGNCHALKTIDVSNFDTSNVTNMQDMFASCYKVTTLDCSSFDTSKVTNMRGVFWHCSGLKTIYVSELWSLKSVTDNGIWMFDNCTNLRGQSGNTYNGAASNMSMANYQTGYLTNGSYTLLKGTEFRKTIPRSTENIVFTDETAPSGVAIKDVSAAKNGRVVSWSEGTTYKVSTQKKGKKVIANEDSSYLFCAYDMDLDQDLDDSLFVLTDISLKNLDTSMVKNMKGMFSGNIMLECIDVSNFNTANVTNMNIAFATSDESAPSVLKTIIGIDKLNTSNVKDMRGIFYDDQELKTLDLSGWDTKNVVDMEIMFDTCSKLTNIYVGQNWNTDKVTSSANMFFDCTSLIGQSGVTYDSKKTDISMANYQSGYLTYKAASQKHSSNDVAKSVLDESIPRSTQSLTTAKSAKIDIDEKKAADEKTDEKGKHGWSGITKQIARLISDHADTVYAAEPDNQTETKKQTPTLLYSHQSLSDIDETFYVPEIETSLTNGDGEHYFAPSADSKLTDTVSYKGLKPGITYVLTGQLMDKDAQEPAKDASGNNITGTTTFTPTASEGTVQVAFSFDGTKLGGKTLVAFETLSGYAKVYGTAGSLKTLAVHKDINDASQTVTNMGISTVAKDKASGSKQVTLSSKTTITDTVSYKGAVAGYKYQLQAVLMDKLTGEAAVDGDGQPITGSKGFTASATSGSAAVDLTFNGAGIPGGEYVVYETLYRITDNGSMEKWASHEDMNDEDQLVNVPGITTQLVDAATNTQFVKASSSVNAVDTVYYEGLLPGQSYTLTGQLIEKATGKVFVDGNGKEMTVTKTFTPAEKSGEVDVEFTLNATNLNTSCLVAYETLSLNGKEIVSERSLDNEYQTLSFPVITSTKAVDKRNGTKVIDAQDDMVIVDTISYTGMQTGLPLTVKSTVMDKATGKAAKDSDGNDIIVESEILPDETNGSIDVEIPIKGRNLMGKTLVVYEEICYADGVVIAQHKDLKDAGQTVTVAGITTTAAIQTTAGQNDRYTSQTVRDTVKYYGLTKGTSYTLQGTLMDKATGNAYQENGKDVTASKTFKASATSGTETLDFEISSSEAKNKTLVVCESVYTDVDGKQVLVAQHSDLTDKDQTVEVPDETVGKLKITKTIQNGNKNKAFKFTITLKGSRIKDSMMLSGVTFTNGVGTISLKHGESKLIEDIPSGTTYRVVEEQSGLYRPIMTTGDAGTIEDGKTAEASFVNMHLKEEEPGEDEVNLTVSKKVLPEDAGAGEKFQFTAVFDHLRANWNYGLSDETEFQSDADGKATVTFTLGKGENITFLHLPAGCTYRFTEAAGAYTSNYAVTDAAGLQKIATASGANTEEDQEISTATETADKGEKVTVTFTNEFQMSQDLTLTKKTVNADGSAYNAKEAFSFTVKFTGLPANAVISSTAGDVTADAGGNAAKNISLKNGEQVIFHELPVGSKYQITENGSEYRPSYSIDAATVVKKTDRIVKRNSSLSTQIETIDKGEDDVVTFTNERIVWYALPNTGSYMLVILIGTTLIMLMIGSRKRKDYLSEK